MIHVGGKDVWIWYALKQYVNQYQEYIYLKKENKFATRKFHFVHLSPNMDGKDAIFTDGGTLPTIMQLSASKT